jgi:hypothetical protein
MRHTDIRTTMNIYGDVVTDEMSTAGLRVAELAFQVNGAQAERESSSVVDSMVDAVGIEPTTCRLRAVEFADPPAAIGCYKLLSFVHFADSPLPANRYPYIPDYALF